MKGTSVEHPDLSTIEHRAWVAEHYDHCEMNITKHTWEHQPGTNNKIKTKWSRQC
jgi:hypothetical protein